MMDTNQAMVPKPQSDGAGAWYMLGVLVVFGFFSYMDRQITSLLVTPIQQDLGLTDLQIGMVQGIAFSAVYAVAGIPIGWAVDRYSRRSILWAGLTLWSCATLAAGFSRSFTHLFGARLLVGAGEAALSPAAYSLIAARFRRDRLGLVFAIYTMGSVVGGAMALTLGGAMIDAVGATGTVDLPLLGALRGWQFVLILAGLPGILAALLSFTFKEPARAISGVSKQAPQTSHAPSAPSADDLSAIAYMRQHPAFFLCHIGGFSLVGMIIYGMVAWMPTFFIREYGWTISQVGSAIGAISAVSGTIGVFGGGFVVDWLYKRGHKDAPFSYYSVVVAIVVLTAPLAFLVHNSWLALALLCLPKTGFTYAGVAASALQLAVPPALRGRISATYLCITGLAGIGLGPVVVGLLTDRLFADPSKLGASLCVMILGLGPLAMLLFLIGRKAMRQAVTDCEARL